MFAASGVSRTCRASRDKRVRLYGLSRDNWWCSLAREVGNAGGRGIKLSCSGQNKREGGGLNASAEKMVVSVVRIASAISYSRLWAC
jgi:hypothetical protein